MRNGWMLVCIFALLACDPQLGRVYWHMGDSNSSGIIEELHVIAADGDLRDGVLVPRQRGDLIVPVASVPFAALGRDLAYFTTRAKSVAARAVPCDAIVVSLGTNDLAELVWPLETWPLVDTDVELDAALDTFLGALPSVPVLWIVPASPASMEERRVHFRRGLLRAQARWPKLVLLDPSPAWFQGSRADGVHWSAEGEGEIVRALVARLDAIFAEAQP